MHNRSGPSEHQNHGSQRSVVVRLSEPAVCPSLLPVEDGGTPLAHLPAPQGREWPLTSSSSPQMTEPRHLARKQVEVMLTRGDTRGYQDEPQLGVYRYAGG